VVEDLRHVDLVEPLAREPEDVGHPLVHVERAAALVDRPDALRARVRDGAVPGLRRAQRLLRLHAVGDVAAVPHHASHGRVEHVGDGLLDPVPGAVLALRPDRERLRPALADDAQEGVACRRQVLGVHEVPLLEAHQLGRVVAEPVQHRGRDVADAALDVEDERQVVRPPAQRLEELRLIPRALLRVVQPGEVVPEQRHAVGLSLLVPQHVEVRQDRDGAAVRPRHHPLDARRLEPPAEHLLQRVVGRAGVLRVVERLDRLPHEVPRVPPDELAHRPVDGLEGPALVQRGLRHGGLLEPRAVVVLVPGPEEPVLPPLRDIEHVAREGPHLRVVAPVGQGLPDPSPPAARVLEAALDDGLAGATGHDAVPCLPERRDVLGVDEVEAAPPAHRLPRPAEVVDEVRCGVEDGAVGVGGPADVVRTGQQRRPARLAVRQRALGRDPRRLVEHHHVQVRRVLAPTAHDPPGEHRRVLGARLPPYPHAGVADRSPLVRPRPFEDDPEPGERAVVDVRGGAPEPRRERLVGRQHAALPGHRGRGQRGVLQALRGQGLRRAHVRCSARFGRS
jgi:hypothetical protein